MVFYNVWMLTGSIEKQTPKAKLYTDFSGNSQTICWISQCFLRSRKPPNISFFLLKVNLFWVTWAKFFENFQRFLSVGVEEKIQENRRYLPFWKIAASVLLRNILFKWGTTEIDCFWHKMKQVNHRTQPKKLWIFLISKYTQWSWCCKQSDWFAISGLRALLKPGSSDNAIREFSLA